MKHVVCLSKLPSLAQSVNKEIAMGIVHTLVISGFSLVALVFGGLSLSDKTQTR